MFEVKIARHASAPDKVNIRQALQEIARSSLGRHRATWTASVVDIQESGSWVYTLRLRFEPKGPVGEADRAEILEALKVRCGSLWQVQAPVEQAIAEVKSTNGHSYLVIDSQSLDDLQLNFFQVRSLATAINRAHRRAKCPT